MKVDHRPKRLVRPLVLMLALLGGPVLVSACTDTAATSTATSTTATGTPTPTAATPTGATGTPTTTASSAATTATAAGCATTTARWGPLPQLLDSRTSAPITNVRAGRHPCFDRLVVDIGGNGAGYTVKYVPQVLSQGQGAVIALRGGAKLDIVITAPTYDINTGRSTYSPANRAELVDVTGFSTFRQIASGGSFEGFTTIGLGVRARLPMRAFILNGPGTDSRVVIDVAHNS